MKYTSQRAWIPAALFPRHTSAFNPKMADGDRLSQVHGPAPLLENDTWTGTAALPTVLLPGRLSLLVSWQDMSGEMALKTPLIRGSPSWTTTMELILLSGVETGWPETVHGVVMGSPKLADIDLDGDLDVVIQSADGWVDVLDDDGSSMSGWPVSGGWSSGNPDVWASPAIINLTGTSSSAPEILAVHPSGCNGFTATGSAISPWGATFPSSFRWFVMCSPVTGDFTENGNNEFVMGRQHRNVYPDTYIGINLLARTNSGSPLWLTSWGSENYEGISICNTFPCGCG